MLTCRHTTTVCSARRQPVAELVDVVDQVDLLPTAIENVAMVKFPDSSHALIRNTETHPLHPLDPLAGRKTIGQRAAFASYSRSVAGRFRNRYGVQELASGASAGQYRLVDLTFTDLRQLTNVAAGLHDVVSRDGLCRITGELVEAVEYRGQLRECVEGAMGHAPEVRGFALFRTAPRQTRPAPLGTARFFPGCRASRFNSSTTTIRNSTLTASRVSNSS
jgi:hypothetical protein